MTSASHCSILVHFSVGRIKLSQGSVQPIARKRDISSKSEKKGKRNHVIAYETCRTRFIITQHV